MSYASASDVAILCPHFLNGGSNFSASTAPTDTAVNAWLSSGSAIIDSKLASYGYSPIPANSGAIDMARDINATYGAWRAEISLLSARISRMENSRGDIFKRDFYSMLDMLCSMDLSTMGVARGNAPPANYAGGISQADKEVTEGDADRIEPRFGRGMFRNPDASMPDVENADVQVRND